MTSSQPHVTILVANLPAERDRRVIRESLTLESAGYQVTVIAPRGDRSLKVLPGSRNTRLRPYPVYVLGGGVLSFAVEFIWSFTWIALLLGKEVLSGRAQAVQVCNPPDVYWPLALAYRLLRSTHAVPTRVVLIERAQRFGPGLAYSTRAAGTTLNVPA